MLLFGRQITAKTACEWGFVTEVFPHNTFKKEVGERVAKLATLPPEVRFRLIFFYVQGNLLYFLRFLCLKK